MANKRIIAHFMHEQEKAAAHKLMPDAIETEGYLLGEVEEKNIKRLEQQGLIIQSLEDPLEHTTAEDSDFALKSSFRSFKIDLDSEIAPKPDFYIISLKGPLLEVWREELNKLKVKLIERIEHERFKRNSYSAKLAPDQVEGLRALNFVSTVRPYGPEETAPPLKAAAIPAPPSFIAPGPPPLPAPSKGLKIETFDIRLHREEDMQVVLTWLNNNNINVSGSSGRKVRLFLMEESSLVNEIATLPEVATIEKYIPPKLHNDMARQLLGIEAPVSPLMTVIDKSGEGQIIGIADTGIDDGHPDFNGRIIGIAALGRQGDHSDPHGHGTHVAGSVLSDGSCSGGTLRGIAPGSKLYFQSLLDINGGLGGLPLNIGDLFEQAYQAGARIHNNSWGAATESKYTINSIEVDEFVAKRRDMLIVISAGNEGDAAHRKNSNAGYVDWLSIGSPASSKNALTIGASRSNRTGMGLAGLTYGQAWPNSFPDPPIANENVSGNSECIAGFSSRGPCDDRRIKPDVVAPGTDIASTKSSKAPLRQFWGPYPGNDRYALMGGTSMSAPIITGCAALVREYYVKDKAHEPSAALMKATLINSTRWLTGFDAVADHSGTPNFHQGFGCIYMPWAIPNTLVPGLGLEFIDTWKDNNQFVQSGQRFRYRFNISGGKYLRICLVWTDLPARALQNNLNLFVQHTQSNQKWKGNEGLPMSLNIPDPDNNVEVVRLENASAGEYIIQITATNILAGPQDFALVVTGENITTLNQFS